MEHGNSIIEAPGGIAFAGAAIDAAGNGAAGRPGRIAWPQVAARLAQGVTMTQAAIEAGCARSTIWRKLKDSSDFRGALAAERARVAEEAAQRVAGLRTMVAETIEREVRAGNLRVVLWLADRLKLVAGDGSARGFDDEDDEVEAARLLARARRAIAEAGDGGAPV